MPNKNKFSILSSSRGKIEFVPNPISLGEKLWPGMLISYTLRNSKFKFYFANSIEILLYPDKQLAWIHFLVEVAYYFSSPDSPAPDVFKVIYRADSFAHFEDYFENEYALVKKMFILSLLKCFGFYPHTNIIDKFSKFENLVLGSVDFPSVGAIKSLKTIVDSINQQEILFIDEWIKKCMMRHPNAHLFKSVPFLMQERL